MTMKDTEFGTIGGVKPQIAAKIFTRAMSSMKSMLDMGEFKFGGKDDNGYKFYKKEVMDQTYDMLVDIYAELLTEGVIETCGCGAFITKEKRGGYSQCQWCNGSGYRNTKEYNSFLDNVYRKKK